MQQNTTISLMCFPISHYNKSSRNYHVQNCEVVSNKNIQSQFRSLQKYFSFSFISLWRQIFFIYFNQSNIFQQIEYRNRYENSTNFYRALYWRDFSHMQSYVTVLTIFCFGNSYFHWKYVIYSNNRFFINFNWINKVLSLNFRLFFKVLRLCFWVFTDRYNTVDWEFFGILIHFFLRMWRVLRFKKIIMFWNLSPHYSYLLQPHLLMPLFPTCPDLVIRVFQVHFHCRTFAFAVLSL